MLYALLAYHVETDVASWTPEKDAAVMTDLHEVHDRLNQKGRLGPAARLGWTKKARTLRGPAAGLVVDGPFAETKEQLLGFYIVDCATEEAAIEAARDLRRVRRRSTRSAPSPSIFPEFLSRGRRLRPTIRSQRPPWIASLEATGPGAAARTRRSASEYCI